MGSGLPQSKRARLRRQPLQRQRQRQLQLLELGVAFYEFFCAAAGEGDRETAVVVLAFDADDGADTVFRMADSLAEERIGV